MFPLDYAVVVFVDIRGFTAWSGKAEVGVHLKQFMSDFYNIFTVIQMDDTRIDLKPNGDGVILVANTGESNSPLNAILDHLVVSVLPAIEQAFVALCDAYKKIMRCAIPLKLGFGINAGLVYQIKYPSTDGGIWVDYASGVMNMASRLCDQARPAGTVIAYDAFPDWRPPSGFSYNLSRIRIKGFVDDMDVWISRQQEISHHPRELKNSLLEFHVGTVCYDPGCDSILLAHRNDQRKIYPSLWETGGGHILEGEALDTAAQRICLSEYGVNASVCLEASITTFLILQERTAIPGVKLLCLFDSTQYKGFFDKRQHTEVRLVKMADLSRNKSWSDAMLIPGSNSRWSE